MYSYPTKQKIINVGPISPESGIDSSMRRNRMWCIIFPLISYIDRQSEIVILMTVVQYAAQYFGGVIIL